MPKEYPTIAKLGKVYMDGQELGDCVRFVVTMTANVESGNTLGTTKKINRLLGFDAKVTVSRRRNSGWIRAAYREWKETGRWPDISMTGVTDDVASDYHKENGADKVTVLGMQPTGDITLLNLDADAGFVKDEITFLADEVIF